MHITGISTWSNEVNVVAIRSGDGDSLGDHVVVKRNRIAGNGRRPPFVSSDEHALNRDFGISIGGVAERRMSVTEAGRAAELVVQSQIEESGPAPEGKIS